MGDKAFILLLILFVIAGVLSYDKYVTEKGEISIVAQFLDFAGLSKYLDWKGTTTIVTKKSFQYNMEENLERLKRFYQTILQQRTELVDNHNEILKQLIEMNWQIKEEAKIAYENLTLEERQFLERFPELITLGSDIMEVRNVTDPALCLQMYESIKQQMIEQFLEVSTVPKEELEKTFAKLDEIVCQEDTIAFLHCDNIPPLECIRKRIKQLKMALLYLLDDSFQDPASVLTKLDNIAEMLQEEYLFAVEVTQHTEEDVTLSDDYVGSRFKDLIRQMVEGTEEDLVDLVIIHEEMEYDHRFILDQIKRENEEWERENQRLLQMQDKIIQQLINLDDPRFHRLLSTYNVLRSSRINLMEKLQENTKQLWKLENQKMQEYRAFLVYTSFSVGFDFVKFKTDREYALAKNDLYKKYWVGKAQNAKMPRDQHLTQNVSDNYRDLVDHVDGEKMGADIEDTFLLPLERQQRKRVQVIKDNMKRLRYKADQDKNQLQF